MRQPLISAESSIWAKILGGFILIFVLPIFIVVKILIKPFERPSKVSADDVVTYLRDFLEGTGDDWDWDDFISIEIADPQLEAIRKRALALRLPPGGEDIALLKELLSEAETIAASDHTAGLPAD
jgi:hypothetical protein